MYQNRLTTRWNICGSAEPPRRQGSVSVALLYTVIACLSCVPAATTAQLPPDALPVNIRLAAAEDRRLEKPVSIDTDSITIKELLDQCSALTGVTLTIDPKDPSSGYRVFICCHDAPVASMLDSLYSAVSIKRGEWIWQRIGDPGAYTYRLLETSWAKDRDGRRNEITAGLLDRFVGVMRKLGDLKPEERQKHSEELRQALLLDKATSLDGFFADVHSDWFWLQATFFSRALSEGDQRQVLDGRDVVINLGSLEPSVYELFHQQFLYSELSTVDSSGQKIPVPEPTDVVFYRQSPLQNGDSLAPMIMLKVKGKPGGGSWMGTGFLHIGVPAAIKRAWMLEGDTPQDAASALVVPTISGLSDDTRKSPVFDQFAGQLAESSGRDATDLLGSSVNLEARLRQVAIGTHTPIVALIPQGERWRPSDPSHKPVQAFLDVLETEVKQHMYKWHNGWLIVSYPSWFVMPVESIPWSKLAIMQPDGRGEAPLYQWAKLNGALTNAEYACLMKQCRYRYSPGPFREMMLMALAHPNVLAPSGSSIDGDNIADREIIKRLGCLTILDQPHLRIRLRPVKSIDNSYISVLFEWVSDKSNKWSQMVFTLLPMFKFGASSGAAN